MLWMNKISQDLSSRWVSEGSPTLQKCPAVSESKLTWNYKEHKTIQFLWNIIDYLNVFKNDIF